MPFATRCCSGAGRSVEQFDRTHCGARRIEAIRDQHPAVGQWALRVSGAVANHWWASVEVAGAKSEDMGGGGGVTHRVRTVGDQQLACLPRREAAIVTVPGSTGRTDVGPTIRHRVVRQEGIRRGERG